MTVGVWEHERFRLLSVRTTQRLEGVARAAAVPLAAAGSAFAGVIHLAVVPVHLETWAPSGIFFVAVAVAQLAWTAAVLRAPSRALCLAGIAGTIGIVAVYIASRTVGIPVGPHAGEAEPVGLLDVLATTAELVAIAGGWLIARGAAIEARSRVRLALVPVALAAIVLAATGAPAAHVHDQAAGRAEDAHPAAAIDDHSVDPAHDAVLADEGDEHDPHAWEPPSCAAPAGRAAGEPSVAAAGRARALVYAWESSIWLHDLITGGAVEIVAGTEDCPLHGPAFRDSETVSFTSGTSLFEVELQTGAVRELVALEASSWISRVAWDERGERVAYIVGGNDASDGSSRLSLRLWDETGDRLLTLLPGDLVGACGGWGLDESLEWSRNGERLLVSAWALDPTGAFVVAVEPGPELTPLGEDVTSARWLDDDRVYLKRAREVGESWVTEWFLLDLATGEREPLPIKHGLYNPSVAPDGTLVYEDDAAEPRLYLYDPVRRAERLLAEGIVLPRWLDVETIAAAPASACTDCHDRWEVQEGARALTREGEISELLIPNVWSIDVLRQQESSGVSPAPRGEPSPEEEEPHADQEPPSPEEPGLLERILARLGIA